MDNIPTEANDHEERVDQLASEPISLMLEVRSVSDVAALTMTLQRLVGASGYTLKIENGHYVLRTHYAPSQLLTALGRFGVWIPANVPPPRFRCAQRGGTPPPESPSTQNPQARIVSAIGERERRRCLPVAEGYFTPAGAGV
ncbi:hypothetical protein NM208_g3594 [Fusarium decemcellulare]|uniref:Uncharacterized protein n=1 Tax=Fusarium decemcellulare TaxID=57161 RepID=A0ACC1SNJ5_9HYPO|nr:hypothetical protein NM208_g3594 [Fusarium decemcellulare]